ncbi:MAG: Sec-independent protein translocase protein TatB, partial [Pseudomonadales bacterium]
MFDVSFAELILIAIVGLLVIGPERLPEALRTLGLWLGRMRRSFTNVKAEIEKEIGMDDIRRQLHNEAVMEEMKRIERDVRRSVDTSAASESGNRIAPAAEAPAAPSTVNTFQGDLEVAAGDTHMGQVMLGNRHAMPVTGFMPADVMGDLVNQHVDPF